MKRRDVVVEPCCTNKKCFICAGMNRKLVIADVEYKSRGGNFPRRNRSEIAKPMNSKDVSLRARPLSADYLQRLRTLISSTVNGTKVIASVCCVSIRTIEKAVTGHRMFFKTRRAVEDGIEWIEKNVGNSEDLC